ncbi:unnamed protein product, partial [Closterium sp. NIES-54]
PAGRRAALCSPRAALCRRLRLPLQPARRPSATRPALPACRPAGRHATLCSPRTDLLQPAAPPFAARAPPLAARVPPFALAHRPAARSPAGRRPAALMPPCWQPHRCPHRPTAARPAVRWPAGRHPAARAPPCCPHAALLAVAPPCPSLRASLVL